MHRSALIPKLIRYPSRGKTLGQPGGAIAPERADLEHAAGPRNRTNSSKQLSLGRVDIDSRASPLPLKWPEMLANSASGFTSNLIEVMSQPRSTVFPWTMPTFPDSSLAKSSKKYSLHASQCLYSPASLSADTAQKNSPAKMAGLFIVRALNLSGG